MNSFCAGRKRKTWMPPPPQSATPPSAAAPPVSCPHWPPWVTREHCLTQCWPSSLCWLCTAATTPTPAAARTCPSVSSPATTTLHHVRPNLKVGTCFLLLLRMLDRDARHLNESSASFCVSSFFLAVSAVMKWSVHPWKILQPSLYFCPMIGIFCRMKGSSMVLFLFLVHVSSIWIYVFSHVCLDGWPAVFCPANHLERRTL